MMSEREFIERLRMLHATWSRSSEKYWDVRRLLDEYDAK